LRFRLGLLAALLGLGFAAAVAAQGFTVSEIRVEGNQRIEPETVRSYMAIAEGDPFDGDKIDRSLKALFATSLFADVAIRQEGRALVVRVVENPVINRIAFEGNKKFESKMLEAEIQLKPRIVYTRTRVQSDVQRLLQLYRRNGRFAAAVEPKVIQLAQNRVDLVFEINEGEATGIRRINFIGNRRFNDAKLREIILTRESRWYRFLTTDDIYDPDRLTVDRERLRRYYLSKGHAEFRVVSSIAELTPDREDFFITFAIEEGEVYRFGDIKVVSEFRDLPAEHLYKYLRVEKGDIYNADDVENSIIDLTAEINGWGVPFVDVRAEPRRNRDKRVIDLTFYVGEGPRIYVERIDITGNVRTLDRVVRREMRVVEGDAFNSARMRRSRQRLQAIGYFEKVDIKQERGSAPDRTIVAVDVKEKSTGELSLGIGFSTADGVLGDVSVRERNFLGKGQDARLGYTLASRRRQFDFSFTEPYFMERTVSAGFDLADRHRNLQRERGYDDHSQWMRLRSGYPITEYLSQHFAYLYRVDDIQNVAPGASRFIKARQGETATSEIGHALAYDRRDEKINPSDGYVARILTDFAGLGGDVTYVRLTGEYSFYYPLSDTLTGVIQATAGRIYGLGEDVRISNRFFLGGGSLRGFRSGGVGPRDLNTGDSLGGNLLWFTTGELRFPVGLPKEVGVLGRSFIDIGALNKVDEAGGGIGDTGSPRVGVGAGISWATPIGPLSLDFARAVIKEEYDRTEFFRINFGTRF